ncbi:unnamed protein product, partial [Cladocopium goreaui]
MARYQKQIEDAGRKVLGKEKFAELKNMASNGLAPRHPRLPWLPWLGADDRLFGTAAERSGGAEAETDGCRGDWNQLFWGRESVNSIALTKTAQRLLSNFGEMEDLEVDGTARNRFGEENTFLISTIARAHALSAAMYQHAQPHIEKLVINNFKSYAGRHEIGPFDKFTSIIGPNGSGKSNIMDAISFCLGIKTKHLRGERLKDLVYRREEETVDANQRGAEVTLVFKSAKGIMRYFSRIINTRGEANYRYGTSTTKMAAIGYEEYSQLLASENIFVRARSFLVFQGDVMQLARRQGSELTAMLETISGSEQLKERYTELSKDLELAQEKARMHFQHRREAETTLTLLEQQRAEVKRFQDLKAQKEALIVEAALFRLYCADRDATKNLEEAQQVREELSKTEHDLRKRRKALEASEVRRQKLETEVRE